MIQVDDRIPDVTLYEMTADGATAVSTAAVFGGRKVALLGLPGAYTPTCHRAHLPGYVEHAHELRAEGVDAIICIAVNDPFVLDHWGRELGAAGKVSMISDGNGDLTRAIGLETDLSEVGLGTRSRRYSALVDDGVVRQLNVEDDLGAHTVCSAAHFVNLLRG